MLLISHQALNLSPPGHLPIITHGITHLVPAVDQKYSPLNPMWLWPQPDMAVAPNPMWLWAQPDVAVAPNPMWLWAQPYVAVGSTRCSCGLNPMWLDVAVSVSQVADYLGLDVKIRLGPATPATCV